MAGDGQQLDEIGTALIGDVQFHVHQSRASQSVLLPPLHQSGLLPVQIHLIEESPLIFAINGLMRVRINVIERWLKFIMWYVGGMLYVYELAGISR